MLLGDYCMNGEPVLKDLTTTWLGILSKLVGLPSSHSYSYVALSTCHGELYPKFKIFVR